MVTSLIRMATATDAPAIAEIYRPIVESTPISFETVAPDADEMRRRIEILLGSHPWLVCERDGVVAGYVYASKHRERAAYRWSVDTSVYVDDRFRRRRIGHALYLSLFAVLHAQGYANAFAGITLPSPASVGLHEYVGFTPVGVYRRVGYKLGAWHDVGWWQRSLEPPDEAPLSIRGLREVQQRQEFGALLATGLAVIRD
ncbi:MAG: arsinothricin resistance N-acetyltransferase ArsN1 family B [Vicinamibacterales bacterium]